MTAEDRRGGVRPGGCFAWSVTIGMMKRSLLGEASRSMDDRSSDEGSGGKGVGGKSSDDNKEGRIGLNLLVAWQLMMRQVRVAYQTGWYYCVVR